MQYEAIIQVAQIQDEDLLYLNFSNAAIGPPYYLDSFCMYLSFRLGGDCTTQLIMQSLNA